MVGPEAPFMPSSAGFKNKAAHHNNLFTKVMETSELSEMIIVNLICRYQDLLNFGASSQSNLNLIISFFTYWNTTKREFLGCELGERKKQAMVERGEITQEQANKMTPGKYVVVGPIRVEDSRDSKIPVRTNGQLLDPYGTFVPQRYATARSDLEATLMFCKSASDLRSKRDVIANFILDMCLHLYGRHIRVLFIYEQKFLDVDGVRALLRACPNLEKLCIHQCANIHLSHVKPILEHVVEFNEIRYENGSNLPGLEVDISPRYHIGTPEDGSYGVFWQDQGQVDSLGGIVAHSWV
ncbi:uncharacterized protein BCR38DRAFT_124676 [Pseudomassariella vexata]|uniref:F-box domain-containing protein n=1 Tax=Pseudomassariella vexata TaxID=1141098 RepID=A0A1Y2D8L4_9PEZI|nr:uncharacterized protein BCR38DRAFT_124676 [Pseudomassariella vexata]ORY55466.1 hypothetical protein BCR38DRAFT_124676 [Pseudomassariella vexata]